MGTEGGHFREAQWAFGVRMELGYREGRCYVQKRQLGSLFFCEAGLLRRQM